MRVADDHMFHGAALIQIAEHERFTAINSVKVGGQRSRSCYLINSAIKVYLKYASKPVKTHGEYVFTFTKSHLKSLRALAQDTDRLFLALVCVLDREICCLPFSQFESLVRERIEAKEAKEDQYTVLVTAEKGKSLRVYMNAPGRKNAMLSEPLLIKRNDFPARLFVK